MKTVAIVQSNYIPWRGYFDLIAQADEFVLFDDVQYTRRDWRNRNKIKVPGGTAWLTIPVAVKGRFRQTVRETRIQDPAWTERHWATLRGAYGRTPGFKHYREVFEELYLGCDEEYLSLVNHRFLVAVCALLGIETPLRWSSDYELADGKSERLLEICRQAGATDYLSGPAARSYLDESLFQSAGIRVHWMDYSGYAEYRQLHPPFEPAVSIVDLIFNEGPDAYRYLKAAGRGPTEDGDV